MAKTCNRTQARIELFEASQYVITVYIYFFSSVQDLQIKQKKRVTFSMGKNESAEEKAIDQDTAELKKTLVSCRNKVKALGTVKEKKDKSTDEWMQTQSYFSMNKELSDVSQAFLQQESNYLQQVKKYKERRSNLTVFTTTNNDEDEEDGEVHSKDPVIQQRLAQLEQELMMKPGISDAQMQTLLVAEKEAMEHDQEIRHIVKEMMELQVLFQEFNALVIEQDALLNRIDQNICTAQEKVQAGNQDLKTANAYQKKWYSWFW